MLTQIIGQSCFFFNVDSVITSNTYVFNLQKSNFYFKVVLSNIQTPDESKEKRRNMRLDCWGVGGGGAHAHGRVRIPCSDASPSRSAGRLRSEGEAEANLPRL